MANFFRRAARARDACWAIALAACAAHADPELIERSQDLLQGGQAAAAYQLLEREEPRLAGTVDFDLAFAIAANENRQFPRAIIALERVMAVEPAQFTSGESVLKRPGTADDALAKGRSLESGDTVVTGANGSAQIRFTDGNLIALRQNSNFTIREYADNNDPSSDRFLVDILRGGMRAITGLIGKRNHDNVKVRASTATVGIRGSAFNLEYNPDGSITISGEQDEIVVCTNVGCVGLKAGESARVVSENESPLRTNNRVTLLIPDPRQDPGLVGNQVGRDGRTTALLLASPPGPPTPVPGNPPTQPPGPPRGR